MAGHSKPIIQPNPEPPTPSIEEQIASNTKLINTYTDELNELKKN